MPSATALHIMLSNCTLETRFFTNLPLSWYSNSTVSPPNKLLSQRINVSSVRGVKSVRRKGDGTMAAGHPSCNDGTKPRLRRMLQHTREGGLCCGIGPDKHALS